MPCTVVLQSFRFEALIIRDELKTPSRQRKSKVCHFKLSSWILDGSRMYMGRWGF